MENILEVTELKKYFRNRRTFLNQGRRTVKAVDGISFSVERGTTFGLVGESGSGKSTVARLIMGILKPDSGKVSLKGESDIVFQDPDSSLNPRMKVSEFLAESLLARKVRKKERARRIEESLNAVRLQAKSCLDKYPHQFSGGERQRISIARALIRRPDIVVLDEPVSSLDVSIQAEILNLLKDLQDELGITYVFISHDLRVIEFMSDVVGVMKDGRIAEKATCEDIYSDPKSEYTRSLLDAIPGM